ncbi:MAG: phage tail sheath subtilisin-like domain-containing protein [Burkholderiales bacterium]
MPEYLSPGVYVEETQAGNKPIEGVSTSTAGLVGVTERGPVNVPQLVTSIGEYRRTFGGTLPIDEFTDPTGRAHCFLPHAVEGFFTNGGKRAYVTRVVPDEVDNATRDMFFADPAVATPGSTVLLSAAQQGTGTAVNQPLLYALDPLNFALGDWVRVGDGSRAEYRQVQSVGANQRHVSLDFPLRRAHANGSAVRAFAVANSGALADPTFQLVNAADAGATQIVIDSGDNVGLVGLLPAGTLPGAWQLLEIGATAVGEYVFATRAEALTGTQVRVTLADPLRVSHAAATAVNVLNLAGGTADTLARPANAGDTLAFVTTAPLPGAFTAVANFVLFEMGTDRQEARSIGALSTLPLTVPTYASYPAGSFGEQVNIADDDRTVVLSALGDPVVTLDSVASLAVGMSLSFNDGGVGTAARIVDAINPTANTVTLRTPLPWVAVGAVLVPAKLTTGAIDPGAVAVPLDDRLGLAAGDVIRIGPDELATVRTVVGERGPPPDAGAVLLAQPVGATHGPGTQVRRQSIAVNTGRQPAILELPAAARSASVLVGDGTGYVAGNMLRFTLPDGTVLFHRLSGNAVAAAPREIELQGSLEFGHPAGAPLIEREQLFEVRALDPGAWGDRLMVACREEPSGLVSNAEVLAANPPPGPGMFSSLQLTTITGVEPGTILELLQPDGGALPALPLLKARRVDRPSRLVLLDAPGLTAAHMAAVSAALLAGQRLRVRSREFSLMVMLRQRPDPATPTRDDNLLDQEVFRFLTMDPRHSRYVERILGATFTPGSATDDGVNPLPLRRSDHRSEGESAYVRVHDYAPDDATRHAIRIGPEGLVDILSSGLPRPARHRLAGGRDNVTLMGDAMYRGLDNTEPALRTGLYTLKNLLTVALVAVPGQQTPALQQAVIDHCEEMRYRFAVLDGPRPAGDTLTDVQNLRQQYDTRYAAMYHPWLTIPDPFPASLSTIRQFPVPPSGHVLGIYARVDNERGVHKAPANEVVRGITGLTRYFAKGEQDILNPYPVNINVIRDFRPNNRGMRVWGARCVTSDSEYKYVNVRRLLIFLEDSIDRGLQWVVFEPNADELWARVRRSVINFLTTVWRNGALEGTTAEQAFFVKCDRTTMTRDDIDNGRLVCVIGVAPVKPAEFVIIRIGLWTADAEQ